MLLATSTTAAGQTALDITVPAGQTAFNFHVQGTDWIPGSSSAATVTITASAEAFGFTEDSTTISYVQAGGRLRSLPATTTSLSASTAFQARVGVPRTDNADIQSPQDRRPATDAERIGGNRAESDRHGHERQSRRSAKSKRFSTPQGTIRRGGVSGRAHCGRHRSRRRIKRSAVSDSTRSTQVRRWSRRAIPGFITTAAGAKTVTVTATAGITFPSNFGQLGGGLQFGQFTGTLGASQHGGVTVRVTSGDPTRVLLAPNTTTPGTAEITFDLANGQTDFSYFLQATDWVSGTSSAAPGHNHGPATGFNTASGTVNYVQPGARTEPGRDDHGPVQPTQTSSRASACPARADWPPLQNRRAGAPPLIVTVTNSNETVAELDDDGGVNGLQEKTASILAGQQSTPSAEPAGSNSIR